MSVTEFLTSDFCDDLGPAKIVHIYDPSCGLKAIVAIDNTACGPSIGGVRMATDVSTHEVFRLARAMTMKNAAAGLAHRGGKAGIVADPRCDNKVELIRAFARAIRDFNEYIPGPDMGTDESCMARIHYEIGRAVGLPRVLGGIPLDEIGATGYGVAECADVCCNFCADAIEAAGLQLPEFSTTLQQKLREFLPAEATVRNPIDLIGSTDPNEFARCLQLLLEQSETDSIIVIYVPQLAETSDAIAARMVDVLQQAPTTQTMLSVFMQLESAPAALATISPSIPAWTFPESAVNALAAAVRLAEWRRRPLPAVAGPPVGFDAETVRRIMRSAAERWADSDLSGTDHSAAWLDPGSASGLLRAAGIPTADEVIAGSVEEAIIAAQQIGFPLVVKAIAPGLLHRTDVGAVAVDIRNTESLRSTSARMFESISGCHSLLIQKFVNCEREVMIGVTREPGFGQLIGFGLGGVDVETLGQVQFRMHPLTNTDAAELVREHPAVRLLHQYRGRTAGDTPALIETLIRISELLTVCPEIAEADFNPVKVLDDGHGVCIVDARIRIDLQTVPHSGDEEISGDQNAQRTDDSLAGRASRVAAP